MKLIKRIVEFTSNPNCASEQFEETFYLRWVGFDLEMKVLSSREVRDYPERYPESYFLTEDSDDESEGVFCGVEKAYYRGNKGHIVLIETDVSERCEENSDYSVYDRDDYYSNLERSRLDIAVTEFFDREHGEMIKNPHAIVLYISEESAGGIMYIINDEEFYQAIELSEPPVCPDSSTYCELEPSKTYDLVKKYIKENRSAFELIATHPYTYAINK